jgi:hypothetical protein
MNPQSLEKLREGAPGCPSELDLDQLSQGELLSQAAARISDHVSHCAMCAERMEARKAGFDAFPAVDTRALLAGIRRRVGDEQEARAKRGLLRRFAYLFTPVAAAAAALMIFIVARRDVPGELPVDVVRQKGSLSLRVHRLVNGQSQKTLSGDHFAPGDRLRFVVDLPSAGHINVIGVEASGGLFVAWPIDAGVSTLREAGNQQELPGAVSLDDSKGRETLYLAHCPAALGVPSAICTSTGAGAEPRCPAGCALTPFVLNK